MASNFKVYAKHVPESGSRADKQRSFDHLMRDYKKAMNSTGLLKELATRQYFESESRKRRRKDMKAARDRLRPLQDRREDNYIPREERNF